MDLVERVKAILLTPHTEWPVIERESASLSDLLPNYVAYLAAIPAVAGFIGGSIIGVSAPVGSMRVPLFSGLLAAVVTYLLSFVIVYIVAVIVDLLAPKFGAQKDFSSALKLTIYCYTPYWLSGIFLIIPGLRFLTILGLYGCYLLWTGLPPLMKAQQDKTLGYAAAIIVCAMVIGFVIAAIPAFFLPYPRAM